MDRLFRELEHELTRYADVYGLHRARHAAFVPYAGLAELVTGLKASAKSNAELSLVEAFLAAHGARPSRLWQTLLIVAFEPLLRRLAARVHTDSEEDLEQEIVAEFLSAVAEVTQEQPDRVAMRLRQQTVRAVYLRVRQERRNRGLESDPCIVTCSVPPSAPDARLLGHLVAKAARRSGDLLGTLQEHGRLVAYVRALHPHASVTEIKRVYSRLQQKRHRLVAKLRRTAQAA